MREEAVMVIAVSGAKDLPKYLVSSAQDATYAVEEELVEEEGWCMPV